MQNALLDLLGGTDGPLDIDHIPTTKNINANTITNSTTTNQDLLDLLDGIDLSAPVLSPGDNSTNGNSIFSVLPPLSTGSIGAPVSLMSGGGGGLFDDLSPQNSTSIIGSDAIINNSFGGLKLTALDKNGVNVTLVPQKSSGCLQVMMTATNNSLTTVEQFLFQAAVPKSFTLQMLSPSGSLLPPGGVITQEMRLTNSVKVCNLYSFIIRKLCCS